MPVQIKTVQCLSPAGLHKMAYKEWGDPSNQKVLVCVHGVTRVSDDFDALAQAMEHEYRVICPDVVGRGRSDWLANPQSYQIPQYVSDMVTLLARLNATTVDWFGTSMGGLIGIGLAAMKESPIRKLLLNDVGPSLNFEALQRIGQYIGEDVRFDHFDDAVKFIREISASFGKHSDAQWEKLARDVLKQNAEGKWMRHYDLKLSIPVKATTQEVAAMGQAMLWGMYDAIQAETLVVRGSDSDLLTVDAVLEMQKRGPKARSIEIPAVGHAPTFVHADQIAIAQDFFMGKA
ncbi:alpha/beta hydrolase [Undibacterium sp. LX40W]|uniref:Alpha/beta hydrolase n=1 Tax=Undibacterium nitidum TaxID=2762298 RepID=A0A923KSI6_9BURK|nr:MULTISPECIES: alpha/beta hydrolase [Undibacterium]MBC3880337.1 alpha/beta hydrolase [Undibacterium nitidum]MBC3890927.1 alpha/beta hydrolase [Undibacterium sp. LX40W]